jgi:hypothetical protein
MLRLWLVFLLLAAAPVTADTDCSIAAHNPGDDGTCIEALRLYAPNSPGYEQRLSGFPDGLKRGSDSI